MILFKPMKFLSMTIKGTRNLLTTCMPQVQAWVKWWIACFERVRGIMHPFCFCFFFFFKFYLLPNSNTRFFYFWKGVHKHRVKLGKSIVFIMKVSLSANLYVGGGITLCGGQRSLWRSQQSTCVFFNCFSTVLRQDLSLSRLAGLAGQKALDSLGLQPHIPGFAWAQGVWTLLTCASTASTLPPALPSQCPCFLWCPGFFPLTFSYFFLGGEGRF